MVATVISVHSRKGGVGKTSIVLSAAVQLAAAGKRVAVLDFDSLGTHLSQCLPLDRDYDLDDEENLNFNAGMFRNQRGRQLPAYPRRPWITWAIDGSPFDRSVPNIGDLGGNIVLSRNLLIAAKTSGVDEARLRKVFQDVEFFLGSCYVRDIDRFNKTISSEEGASRVKRLLDALRSSEKLGYDFLLIDNPPGLSFSSAVVLAWVLELPGRPLARQATAHAWFVTQPPWWEQGLVVYETNVYSRLLQKVHPVIVVNRVRSQGWTEASIKPGQVFSTGQHDRILGERLFLNPLWRATELNASDLLAKFFTPAGFKFVVLGEDKRVTDSTVGLAGPTSELSDPETKITGMIEQYVAGCLIEPLLDDSSCFHKHMSALVGSVLEASA